MNDDFDVYYNGIGLYYDEDVRMYYDEDGRRYMYDDGSYYEIDDDDLLDEIDPFGDDDPFALDIADVIEFAMAPESLDTTDA
jgi:hypothetical protein